MESAVKVTKPARAKVQVASFVHGAKIEISAITVEQ